LGIFKSIIKKIGHHPLKHPDITVDKRAIRDFGNDADSFVFSNWLKKSASVSD
jgi:hypothetical protein